MVYSSMIINMLAFFGSFIVYTSWFAKYYWPEVRIGELSPEQMPIAVLDSIHVLS